MPEPVQVLCQGGIRSSEIVRENRNKKYLVLVQPLDGLVPFIVQGGEPASFAGEFPLRFSHMFADEASVTISSAHNQPTPQNNRRYFGQVKVPKFPTGENGLQHLNHHRRDGVPNEIHKWQSGRRPLEDQQRAQGANQRWYHRRRGK
jgi:hypothetical protein